MKKILLTAFLAVTGFLSHAQSLETAKDLLSRKKIGDAKIFIDGVLATPEYKDNSEAWYEKAKIYLAVQHDDNLKSTIPGARDTAFAAIKKYIELEGREEDERKRNILLTLENNQPLVDIYSGFSGDAASFYNAGNYNDALRDFKSCLAVFDFMSENNVIPVKLDTTTTLYAGISAEKTNKPDEAATFYAKIAENKCRGEGFVEIYKWLADYYNRKDDVATASKFSKLGREVYPDNPFWTSFDLNMLRDKGSKEQLFDKYEEVIRENPHNHIYLFNYGVELYQAGYDEDLSKRPANSKDLIEKAQAYLNK